ncbi:hypothetical protein F511_27565 [Dorcoceras hygrometricum]|uniref:Uncharacterized protein n=1 Tax=Dorcoceras hygrometricum TaxID=472368 RepID=A0A2Z7D4C9_9LAMI|nr:hypothetical protein F511_27565 [Dorcoceras hygrometricum]
MVDRIEGHSHGHAMAKQTAEQHGDVREKHAVDMEDASKVMAEGILAYVKALVSHIFSPQIMGISNTKNRNKVQGVLEQAKLAALSNSPKSGRKNRNAGMIDLELVRETVQELYGPALRVISRPEFHKPYPEVIDHNNPYPRGL